MITLSRPRRLYLLYIPRKSEYLHQYSRNPVNYNIINYYILANMLHSKLERSRVLLSTRKDASGRNNWQAWVLQSKDSFARFGKLCEVFDTNVAYVVPPLDPTDWAQPQEPGAPNLTEGAVRDLYVSSRQARLKKVANLEEKMPELYAALHGSLSVESRIAAAGHADFGGVAGADAAKCPNRLWVILREIHFLDVHQGGGAAMVVVNQMTAVSKYEACRQVPGRSIAEFRVEFDEHHAILVAVGAPGYPSTDDCKAVAFLSKLDPTRHGDMQIQLLNDAKRPGAVNAYPTTVNAAYELASTWTSRVRVRGTGDGEHASVFATILSDTLEPASRSLVKKSSSATQLFRTASSVVKKTPKDEKDKRATKRIETRSCFNCGDEGHIKRNCPKLKTEATSAAAQHHALISTNHNVEEDSDPDEDDDNIFHEDCHSFMVAMTVRHREQQLFVENEVILDCAAGSSIFHNEKLLSNIRHKLHPSSVRGANKDSPVMVSNMEGDFVDLGIVASIAKNAVGNLLSQGELVAAGCRVTYDSDQDVFTIKGRTGESLCFARKRDNRGETLNYWTCIFPVVEEATMMISPVLVQTVESNARRFTAREVKQARMAVVLKERLGHAPQQVAIDIVNRGLHNSDLTATDVRNAERIFGASLASLKGSTKQHPPMAATSTLSERVTQAQQVMHVDIMFVKSLPFLLGVLSPLGLTMCELLKDRSAPSCSEALRRFVSHAASRSFDIQEIRCDGEKGVGKLKTELEELGMSVQIAGPGQHAPVAERMIQTVKQRVRAFDNTLPFVMDRKILVYCTLFCVRSINLQASSTSTDKTSPFEQFSGLKLDMIRDLRVGFGDYVQATEPDTDNTMKSRTKGCIALLPTGNATGSVKMLCLETLRLVIRDQFVVIPMPTYLIEILNKRASDQGFKRGSDLEFPPFTDTLINDGNVTVEAEPTMIPILDSHRLVVHKGLNNDILAHDAGVVQQDVAEIDQEEEQEVEEDHQHFDTPQPRRSVRIAAQSLSSVVMTTMSIRAALRDRGDSAKKVIVAELSQMLDKKVWHGVNTVTLTTAERKSIIRSKMFLKDKYAADGSFEKLKARLVAGGDQQDKGLYDDLSSPTAATSSVLTIAAIAAQERRSVMVIDIGGAYLNASMKPSGVRVRMSLDRTMSDILCEIDEQYAL